MAARAAQPPELVTVECGAGAARSRSTMERLILAVATAAFGLSVAIQLGVLAGADLLPGPPWSWTLHAGAVGGFWLGASRITAARLWGVAGLLRMRRMVPIPVRLSLGAATLNALVVSGLALAGGVAASRALLAYWTMMYLSIAVIFGFVVPGLRAAEPVASTPGGRV